MGALSYVCARSIISIKNDRLEVLRVPALTDMSLDSVDGRFRIWRTVVSGYKEND